jgi:hypothetical protein
VTTGPGTGLRSLPPLPYRLAYGVEAFQRLLPASTLLESLFALSRDLTAQRDLHMLGAAFTRGAS